MARYPTGRRQGSTTGDADRMDRRNAATRSAEARQASPVLNSPPRAWRAVLKGGGVRWFEHAKRLRAEMGDPYRRQEADVVCALAVALHELEIERQARRLFEIGGPEWIAAQGRIQKAVAMVERMCRAAGIKATHGKPPVPAGRVVAPPPQLPQPAQLPPSLTAV